MRRRIPIYSASVKKQIPGELKLISFKTRQSIVSDSGEVVASAIVTNGVVNYEIDLDLKDSFDYANCKQLVEINDRYFSNQVTKEDLKFKA